MKSFRSLSVVAAGLVVSTAASAAVAVQYDFDTPGDTEGFLGQSADLSVANGVLTGVTTAGDPQLRQPDAVVSTGGSQFDEFTAVVRELDANGNVVQPDSSNGGLILIFDFSVSPFFNFGGPTAVSDADADGFRSLTWDLESFDRLDTGFIRFDPVNGVIGNSFEVASITITDDAPIPEPASLALLGLGSVALLGRRSRRA